MQRAVVRPGISERVLGHVITGVAGVYDRHEHQVEKRHALDTLAATLKLILEQTDKTNVIPIRPTSLASAND
ncbi:MAG: hypothetical protein SGJ03_01525 [Alphaproteobacteria bacterium]|nr:hypothetical protein [Alphaproteobacteria bacterium]